MRIISLVLLSLALNVMMYAKEKETRNFDEYCEIEKAKCTKTFDALGIGDGTREELMQLIEERFAEKISVSSDVLYNPLFDDSGEISDSTYANFLEDFEESYKKYLKNKKPVSMFKFSGETQEIPANDKKRFKKEHQAILDMLNEKRKSKRNELRYIGSDVPCSTLTMDDIVKCKGYSNALTCKVVGTDRSFYNDLYALQLRNDLNINQYDSNVVNKILPIYEQESKPFVSFDTFINKSSGYLLSDNTLASKIGKTLENFYKYYKITNLKRFDSWESNPYQQDGSLYMGSGGGRLFQIIKANEGLYEVGDSLIYVKSIGNAPSSLSGKYLVKNGVYKYRTTGGYENTIPLFKEIKINFSSKEKWFVK